MNLKYVNYLLGAVLLLVVVTAVAMRADHSRPNIEFVPMMRRSAAYDAYSANPVLPNGRTLQGPVAGTIARGDLPLYYTATKEDAARAGEELENPLLKTIAAEAGAADQASNAQEAERQTQLTASIQRGAGVYNAYCNACHGPSGAGDGPVAKRGFPPPPSLTTGKSLQMKDGQLFHILTYGQGSMASMAAQLPRARRWDVVNYVRSMQQGAKQEQASNNATGEPNEAAPEKAAPEKIEPEKAQPKKVEPEKAAPNEAAPEKGEPEKAEPPASEDSSRSNDKDRQP